MDRHSLRPYQHLLGTYLWPLWPRVSLLAALLAGGIAVQLVNPQVVRAFLDAATGGRPVGELVTHALVFLVLALVHQGLAVAVTYVGEDVGWRATNRLRADLTRHCLALSLSFHGARTPGELIERIDGDATALSNFFSQFVLQVLGNLLLLVGVLAALFLEDWRVGASLALWVLVALAVLVRLRERAVPASRAERQASAELYGFVEERLAGLDDLRANGAGGYTMGRFATAAEKLVKTGKQAWLDRSLLWLAVLGTLGMSYAIALGFGAWLYGLGAISLGTVYLFVQYTELLQNPIEELTRQMQDFQKATAGLLRIAELFAISERLDDGGTRTLPAGALAVACEDVTFGYRPGTPVLSQIRFALPAGSSLGLLGRTGSGKSTLTRLLVRLADPQAGSVRLGGIDLREVAFASLRGRVAMVTQDVQLFEGSLRDNLSLFDSTVSDARLVAALTAVELGEWLSSLKDGLDTRLSPGGLSGGEAQLIAFARVLLADPGLVVLDEPSSRLDPATEARIERAIARLMAGRTTIVIAHRLSTVRRVDAILVLDGGEIAEFGARTTLAGDPTSRFARLLARERDLMEIFS